MTRRSIVNLTAFAIIAGGGMLLGARPAAAAPSAFCELCDKMSKRLQTQQSACNDAGGQFEAEYSCSCTTAAATLITQCN
ncbi:MAG: hypothetical protein ACJ8J0_14590 [Longimicrobiaceae bacterium]